jgi:hypothetical protein
VAARHPHVEPARPGDAPTVVAAGDVKTLLAVLSAIDRKGEWVPALNTTVLVALGGGTIDLREATLHPVTTFDIYAFLGGLEIIVDPGVVVETSGAVAILGGFEEKPRPADPPPAGAPVVRITGFALLAGIVIHFRYRGETEADENRRLGSYSTSS